MNEARIATPDALFGGSGNVLQKLKANNWDIDKALRTNATLPKSAWVEIDKTVLEVAGQRLNGIADLQSRNLTRDLRSGGLGIMYDYWQTMSEGGDAEQSMSGITAGAENTLDFDEQAIPLPITFVDFRIPLRKLMAMERFGSPLDTTMVAQATRKVIEKLEDCLFNGSSVKAGGRTLYGYMNYTHSNALTSLAGNWSGTPANIELDVIKLITALEGDRHYGPYILYVHANEWADLRQRDSTADRTYFDIVKSMKGIEDIKVTNALSANDIALVEMTRETVDLDVAVDVKVVEWDTHGGMQSNYKIMAVIAPRIKSDYDGRCGIVYDTDIGSS